MNTETYDSLPADVKDKVADTTVIDSSVPAGQVRLSDGTQLSVADFIKTTRIQSKVSRRAAHKRERQNKRLGRRNR